MMNVRPYSLEFKGKVPALETSVVAQQTQNVFKCQKIIAWRGLPLVLRSLRIGLFEQLAGVDSGTGLELSHFSPLSLPIRLEFHVASPGIVFALSLYNPTGVEQAYRIELAGQTVAP